MESPTYTYISTHKRFWEIDLLRTVVVVMMVTFHALYLLNYLNIQNTGVPGPYHGFWWWIARAIVASFTFLAGVSLTISHSRSKKRSGFVLRGLKIFAWAMVITLLTWLIAPNEYVRFGILHFFGIAFMLGPLFLRFRFINLVLGAALLAAGIYLQEQRVLVDFPWLLWLGLMPHGFRTLDYSPLLPWFGLFLVGMFCGKMLYPGGKRIFSIRDFNDSVTSTLTFPGRHPLVMYIAQWPAIIGVLLVLYPDKVLPHFPF
ncbi:MAG: heparan-alpha-glucosaminide N-acetyltransferase [Dehalococcoidia bacterium]